MFWSYGVTNSDFGGNYIAKLRIIVEISIILNYLQTYRIYL